MNYERIQVTCLDETSSERPISFVYRGRRLEIVEITDRWYEGGGSLCSPGLNYFRVRTDAEGEFILRYNALFDAWALLIPDRAER